MYLFGTQLRKPLVKLFLALYISPFPNTNARLYKILSIIYSKGSPSLQFHIIISTFKAP